MKEWQTPTLEILEFPTEDILTASSNEPGRGDQGTEWV